MNITKRLVSILLILCTLLALVPTGIQAKEVYNDVNKSDWFYDYVMYVHNKGLMQGTGNGNFSPKVTTNRAMLVTILHRLEETPKTSKKMPFTDVEEGQWYTDAIAWASAEGVVNGTSATTFNPNGLLTREQAAQIFYNYAKYKGYFEVKPGNLGKFNDSNSVSSWASFAMNWAVGVGLINGTGNGKVSPQMTASRDQMATLLMNFCENIAADAKVLYNITFMYNDGSNTSYRNTFAESKSTVVAPEAPERIGYSFTGWYTDKECTAKFDFNQKVTKSITLYAGWESQSGKETDSSAGGGTGYTVTGIEMNSNIAEVTLNVNSKSILMLEFLNENENKTFETISVETPAYCELGIISIPVSAELPQYFVIKASVYDLNGNLLDSYKCIKYTENYAKFDAQTIDSFPGERVLSFDSNKDTNFGVLADGVKEISIGTKNNVLTVEEKEINEITIGSMASKYTFANPDAAVKALKKGDAVYASGNSQAEMFKVGSVTQNPDGSISIVPDEKTEVGDFYKVLKIGSGADAESSVRSIDVGKFGRADEVTVEIAQSVEIGKNIKLKGDLKGTLTFNYEIEYDINLFKDNYFHSSFISKAVYTATLGVVYAYDTDVDINKDGFLSDALEFKAINVPTPVTGLNIYSQLSVPLSLEAEAGGEAVYTSSCTSGFTYDTINGRSDIDEKSREFSIALYGKVEVKFGPKFAVGLSYLGEAVKAEVNMQAGLKFEGEAAADLYKDKVTTESSVHACDVCIDGYAGWFIDVKAELSYNILDIFKGKPVDMTIISLSGNITIFGITSGKFYCSTQNEKESVHGGKFKVGGGECPNKKYRVTVKTLDASASELTGYNVNIINKNETKSGVSGVSRFVCYLYPGDYTATFVWNDKTIKENFNLNDNSKEVTLKVDEADIYTEYLLNGEYNSLFERTDGIDKSNVTIYTYLIDYDYNGVKELFIDLSGYGERIFGFYTINKNGVKCLKTAYYPAGNGGGDSLSIQYDKQTKKYLLMFNTYVRMGIHINDSMSTYYSGAGLDYFISRQEQRYSMESISYTESYINKIKNETNLYTIENNTFYAYKISGNYVTQKEYTELTNRFEKITFTTSMYKGTYNQPIKKG